MYHSKIFFFLTAFAIMGQQSVQATDGTRFHGYGARAQGMGGTGIGYFQDTLSQINNPAGIAWVGNRTDVEGLILKANRGAVINGQDFDSNGKSVYVFPTAGVSRQLDETLTAGVAVYPRGAGTVYRQGIVTGVTNPVANTEAELAQLIFTPTLAYRLSEKHTVGLTLNIGYQRFYAKGLEPLHTAPGRESSWGAGVSVGWAGKLTERLMLGATYSSKIYMGKLDKYDGLLANQGEMDIPEQYGLGMSFRATDKTTLALDYLRINYSDVRSLGNSVYAILTAAPGSRGGPGFGWRDQNAFKIGVHHAVSDALSVRAGYSHNTAVIPSSETALNYLAQIMLRTHYSLGATIKPEGSVGEWSLAYTYVPMETLKGSGRLSGQTDIYHQQHWLAIGYSW